jgi:hypothetical protein
MDDILAGRRVLLPPGGGGMTRRDRRLLWMAVTILAVAPALHAR